MPRFPVFARKVRQGNVGTHSPESIITGLVGTGASINTSLAWPSANLAIFVPVEIYEPIIVAKLSIANGTTVGGNIDIGVYDYLGNKYVTSGAVLQSGTSTYQAVNVNDVTLLPNLYYMSLAKDNVTGTVTGWGASAAIDVIPLGVFQQASAFPLPAVATFARVTQTVIPWISLIPRAVP